jgi:hypothetical protein
LFQTLRLTVEVFFNSGLVGSFGAAALHVGETHEAEGNHAAFKELGEDGEEGAEGHFAADVSGEIPVSREEKSGPKEDRTTSSYTVRVPRTVVIARRRGGGQSLLYLVAVTTRAGLGWRSWVEDQVCGRAFRGWVTP